MKTEEIREKLIVILPGEHKNTPSFITKGAIGYLRGHDPNAQILGFHWRTNESVIEASEYMIDSMLSEIPSAMQATHKAHSTEDFRADKIGHRIYLTLAFCHLLRAAKLSDLKACFAAASIPIDETTLRHCIDTLTICHLVKAVEQGRLTYYVARVARMPFEIAFRPGTSDRDRDTMRWIVRIKDQIEKEDGVRLEMFREHHDG